MWGVNLNNQLRQYYSLYTSLEKWLKFVLFKGSLKSKVQKTHACSVTVNRNGKECKTYHVYLHNNHRIFDTEFRYQSTASDQQGHASWGPLDRVNHLYHTYQQDSQGWHGWKWKQVNIVKLYLVKYNGNYWYPHCCLSTAMS